MNSEVVPESLEHTVLHGVYRKQGKFSAKEEKTLVR